MKFLRSQFLFWTKTRGDNSVKFCRGDFEIAPSSLQARIFSVMRQFTNGCKQMLKTSMYRSERKETETAPCSRERNRERLCQCIVHDRKTLTRQFSNCTQWRQKKCGMRSSLNAKQMTLDVPTTESFHVLPYIPCFSCILQLFSCLSMSVQVSRRLFMSGRSIEFMWVLVYSYLSISMFFVAFSLFLFFFLLMFFGVFGVVSVVLSFQIACGVVASHFLLASHFALKGGEVLICVFLTLDAAWMDSRTRTQ